MLTIRNAQLLALEVGGLQDFLEVANDMLRRKHHGALHAAPAGYAERLLTASIDACQANGFDETGSVIEFAEALIKNDQHPMEDGRIEAKCRTVLCEFRSRAVFMRWQALEASTSVPIDEPDEPVESAAEPAEE